MAWPTISSPAFINWAVPLGKDTIGRTVISSILVSQPTTSSTINAPVT